MKKIASNTPVLLFDGVCNLCNSAVQFCIKNDATGKIKFTPLQSDYGQHYLKKFDLDTEDFDTVVLVSNEQHYTKSDVPLQLAKHFDGWYWRLFLIFYIIPKFIRDAVYDFIAKNRYRWFGKKESCMMPTPDLKQRFL